MIMQEKKKTKWWKWLLILGLLMLLVGGGAVWYIFNLKFEDTSTQKANFTVNAYSFIKEFEVNDTLANKKYIEKMVIVNGRVSETENADSTVNIKMVDTLTDAYIIFAFQPQNANDAKTLKVGDSVAIKGSCSGGAYSEILETTFITFKRCVINK
jgi:flagellar basal body-associated protein FliL